MNFESWLLFASIAFMTSLIPGPAVFLSTMHSIVYGLKNTLATIAGNVTGLFIMSALSVLGLSTIIIYSTLVFMAVKYLGAVYLIYLGIKLWRQGFGTEKTVSAKSTKSAKKDASGKIVKLYMHGLFVALSNPKGILFTTALFPQFIIHTQPVFLQFSILVLTFMSTSFICLFSYAYIAANAGGRTKSLGNSSVLSKLFGTAFITSGIFLANATQKQA